MKKQELQEFKKKTVRDLSKTLTSEKDKLNELKFNLSLGKVDNVHEIRLTKKNISQLLTLIKQKNK